MFPLTYNNETFYNKTVLTHLTLFAVGFRGFFGFGFWRRVFLLRLSLRQKLRLSSAWLFAFQVAFLV
jgi:hypothetical protein